MDKNNIQFSEREKDVIQLLLQGKGNKQIALELSIANRTVEFHLSNVYTKLKVSSRAEAILKLTESDLRKPTGDYQVNSTVADIGDSTENGFKSILRRIPVKKLYYIIGSLLAVILIVVIVIPRLSVPNSELKPTAVIEQTPTQSIETSTATLPAPTEILQPVDFVPQTHTVNGYTVTVESAHADIAHLIFTIRITGGDITFGDEHYYGRISGQDIYDEYGNLINSSGGFGPAIEDLTLIQMGFEPVTLFTEDHLKGQLVFDINNAPDYNEKLAHFSFDFDLPIYPEKRFFPKQVVTANGLEVLLDSITVTPTFTQAYLCFKEPTHAPWAIGRNSTLQIGEQQATLYSSRLLFFAAVGGDKRGTSEPYWVPPVKDGMCLKYGFPVGTENPTSLTLTIPKFENILAGASLSSLKQLAINYPGMNPTEALSKYLEENGGVYKGPWVFTVELKP